MKVTRITPDFSGYQKQVQGKDKAEQERDEFRHHQNQQNKKNEDDQEALEVTDESVAAAIESFQTDDLTQSSGITADSVGQGPGLKVVLKDTKGHVLKQLSGEEFIKLREKVSAERSVRGKILDQKV